MRRLRIWEVRSKSILFTLSLDAIYLDRIDLNTTSPEMEYLDTIGLNKPSPEMEKCSVLWYTRLKRVKTIRNLLS